MTDRKASEEQYINEFDSKQRNILWEDRVKNAQSVDSLLWKGSERTTAIQRTGMGVFSILFLFMGVFLFLDCLFSKEFLVTPIPVAIMALGVKVGIQFC